MTCTGVSQVKLSQHGLEFLDWRSTSDNVQIQMGTSGQSYVAAGFGTVQDMGPAVVVACSQETDAHPTVPSIAMYYNRGKVTPDLLTNSTLAISSPKTTYVNGVLWCSFNILAKVQVTDPKDENNNFDLDLNLDVFVLE